MSAPFGIVGGGGFGTGLAHAISRNERDAILWSRRSPFSGGTAPPRVTCTKDISALREAELIFIAVPSMHVAAAARELCGHIDGRHLLVHVSRGLVGDELAPVSALLRSHTPSRRVGCLAGPLSARSLMEGSPGGGIVGSGFPEVAESVREALAGPTLRLYATSDVTGTEVSSALVGLLALAVGYAQEMGIGPGALAMMATRGMVESARVGKTLGAEESTFSGLAGYGDLIAAIAGDGRPELDLGRGLARGLPIAEAARAAGAYIEGVSIARRLANHAAKHRVEVPIAAGLADAIEGKASPTEILGRLMTRRQRDT